MLRENAEHEEFQENHADSPRLPSMPELGVFLLWSFFYEQDQPRKAGNGRFSGARRGVEKGFTPWYGKTTISRQN